MLWLKYHLKVSPKNIPVIEFFCIAIGFVIRSISGGLASETTISYWFILSIGIFKYKATAIAAAAFATL